MSKPQYLAEVGSVDLGLRDLWPLCGDGVVVLVIHSFLFVQTLQREGKDIQIKVKWFEFVGFFRKQRWRLSSLLRL